MRRLFASSIVILSVGALALPAGAETQTVDATLGNTLAMSTAPSSTVSGWPLAYTGPNTTSGGTMTVSSNVPYTATVTADKTRMTEYVTATSSYVATSPKALSAAFSVLASRTGGTAPTAGVGATAVVGTSTTLATGTGLGTDTYSLTLSQPTLIADPALPSGRTYHLVLTYTLTSIL